MQAGFAAPRAAGRLAALALTLALAAPGSARAQGTTGTPAPQQAPTTLGAGDAGGAPGEQPRLTLPSPILTINPDRLFSGSAYGQRVETELDAEARALAAQNREIEAALSAEEQTLTQERPTKSPEEFRKLADAFDAKVQGIRKAQEDKSREIADHRDAERQKFLQLAMPILGELMRHDGAVAIMNQQSLFLSLRSIDVTDRAIAAIDAKIGDGAKLDTIPPPTAPGPAPDQPAAPEAAPTPAAPASPVTPIAPTAPAAPEAPAVPGQ